MDVPRVPPLVDELLGPQPDGTFPGLQFDVDESAYVANRKYNNLLVAMLLRTEGVTNEHGRAAEAIEQLVALLPNE